MVLDVCFATCHLCDSGDALELPFWEPYLLLLSKRLQRLRLQQYILLSHCAYLVAAIAAVQTLSFDSLQLHGSSVALQWSLFYAVHSLCGCLLKHLHNSDAQMHGKDNSVQDIAAREPSKRASTRSARAVSCSVAYLIPSSSSLDSHQASARRIQYNS